MHLFAAEIGLLGTVPMVAGTIPIAVGAALSAVMQGSDAVSVAFFGDGATEEGVFQEALNFAALKKLPVIFVCENNLFSSHLPLVSRRPLPELHRFAEPYGIPGHTLDGNDVIKVYQTTGEAVGRARAGGGPSLLECITYRWRGHVGPRWDLDVGIRSQEELDAWMARCPIKRWEMALIHRELLSTQAISLIYRQVEEEVERSVQFARESPDPRPEDMPKHVYSGGE